LNNVGPEITEIHVQLSPLVKDIQTHLIILFKHVLQEADELYHHKLKDSKSFHFNINKEKEHIHLDNDNFSDSEKNKNRIFSGVENQEHTILSGENDISSTFTIPSAMSFSFDYKFVSLMKTPWHQLYFSQYGFYLFSYSIIVIFVYKVNKLLYDVQMLRKLSYGLMRLDSLSWRYLLHKILDGSNKDRNLLSEKYRLSLSDLRKNKKTDIISPVVLLSHALNPRTAVFNSTSLSDSVPSWAYHRSAQLFYFILFQFNF
jgi:hypothetical protein